jgi:hypothetical protein
LWSSQDDGYGFINVPIGYEVTGVLVGVDNNEELFYGILDFTIDENGIYPINMQPVTEADLEDILDAL